ncbi:MAG: hypothetical protein SNJ77_12065 [Cytophagales bacterium]
MGHSSVVHLTPPLQSKYALMVVEADPTSTALDKVVRFTEAENQAPTDVLGIPLGDLGIYESKGKGNMECFGIIGIEVGKIHKLNIQYFA